MNTQNNSLIISTSNTLKKSIELEPAEPLWKRAPTRDAEGRAYSDFMMLIPGLRDYDEEQRHSIVMKMEHVLKSYESDIILADLNLKLNVLWVTLKPHLGITVEIAALLHHVIPEAKLVSQYRA